MPFLKDNWGNPSSVHHLGVKARASLDDCRDRAASILRCKPSEVIFMSGGTESVNLAILGSARCLKSKGRHIVTSSIEHHAVLHSCRYLAEKEGFEVSYVPVSREGFVAPDDVALALRSDTVLVSIMAANNEIGTIQPVNEIGALCRDRGILFHTDAVQWFGKEPFSNIHQFNADLVSICGHKFYGPKGVGALFVKSPFHPDPLFFGGGHENERRAGTENLAAIAGFVEALTHFVRTPVYPAEKLTSLSNHLISTVKGVSSTHLVSPSDNRLVNTVSFVVEGSDSIALLANFDLEGICASSGSACSAGSIEPSHVVSSLGYDSSLANSLVRFSLGRDSSLAEVEFVSSVLPDVIHRSQRLGKPSKTL